MLQDLLTSVDERHKAKPNVTVSPVNVILDQGDRVRSQNITLFPELSFTQSDRSFAVAIKLVQTSIFAGGKADIMVVHFIFGAVRHDRVAFHSDCSVRLLNVDRRFEESGPLLGLTGNGIAEEPEKWRVLFCEKSFVRHTEILI